MSEVIKLLVSPVLVVLLAIGVIHAAENEVALDLVIANGQVIDPESGLNAVRHVGIRDGRITVVSPTPLNARLSDSGESIDATGLIVAPGFIDLHAHGQSLISSQYQARDGVTTALELESGVYGVREFLAARQGRRPIHFGTSVSQNTARILAFLDGAERTALESALRQVQAGTTGAMLPYSSTMIEGRYAGLEPARYEAVRAELLKGLQEGGIGIGLAHQYSPGTDEREVFDVFKFAAEQNTLIFTHVRSTEPLAMQEVIVNSTLTGAPLHIVHVNSMSLGYIDFVLEMISTARDKGIDVSTEVYPYTAGSTSLQSALFDEGWQDVFDIDYGDLQWVDTGERLNQETFELYRARGGAVIIHMMEEDWVDRALAEPYVIVASDGMPYAPGAHPRSAGTFSRVLGRYVRERQVLDLELALRKMTLMPAQRLEPFAPMMARKGRIQVGADADITVFNPNSVIDTATFEEGLSFSEGVEHVLVLGVPVVRDGETVEGTFPGRAITGRDFRAEPANR